MKILQKGRQQKGWAKEYICTGNGNKGGGCGAKLLVEWEDVFKTKSSDYSGSSDVYLTFQCCECGVLTDIPFSDPPDFMLIPDKDVWLERQRARGDILHG